MWTVVAIAGGAALASVAGGALTLLRRTTTLAMSVALGFAAGVLLATVTLEMLPQARELVPTAGVVAGFAGGFVAMWLFELAVNRGQLAGEHAAQIRRVARFHRRHPPHGDRTTVLAGGTAVEEVVEGLAIGTGVALGSDVGLVVAIAIAIDNLSEGISIGELALGRRARRGRAWRRVIGWTAAVGASLFVSAIVGWAALRDADPALIGALLAAGAGGMLYLVVTQLVPTSQERQYEGSAALATAAGFVLMLVVIAAL
jgi:ZIP family zinc transporter